MKSDNDWRVKGADQKGLGTRISHRQEVPVAQFSRQQERQYIRKEEPQYLRHQELLYSREQKPQHVRQQEPQHPMHQEPLFHKPQKPLYQRLQEPFYQRQQENFHLAAGNSRSAKPWLARRGVVSEKEKVLRTVQGVLNKLMPENFKVLVKRLLNAGIVSADLLKAVTLLVFDKAVLEPMFCSIYAEMCLYLSKALPEFPCDEGYGNPITFRRILLDSCQQEFEWAVVLRAETRQLTKPDQEAECLEKEELVKLCTLGIVKFIGELFKQKMITKRIVGTCISMLSGSEIPPAEENIEALCQLLATVGKQMEDSNNFSQLGACRALNACFSQLKEFSTSPGLPPRIRFIILNTIDLRANNWVPHREMVKGKRLNEIYAEAENTLGLCMGTTGMGNTLVSAGVMGSPGTRSNIPHMRPGMLSLLQMTGTPAPAILLCNVLPGQTLEGGSMPLLERIDLSEED